MDSLTSQDKSFISGLNLDFHKFTVKYATTEDNCLSAVRSVPVGPLFVSQPIPPQEQPIPGTSAQPSLPPPPNKKQKYICDQCGAAKSRRQELQAHLLSSHKIGERSKCTECDKSLIGEKNLKTHYKNAHLNEYLYNCQVCTFKTN